jgi:5-hydroxyisourate hydrolase-like protein (transthyretin family)
MAPLDARWFSGSEDLPELIAENLEVAGLGQPVNAVLGKNGWDGKPAAGVGLELSNDNRSVKSGQFFLRGPLSDEDGTFQASRLWEQAARDIGVRMKFPSGDEFDFSEGSLASEYLDGENVEIAVERNGQPVPPAEGEGRNLSRGIPVPCGLNSCPPYSAFGKPFMAC